jgi:pterin-4a-carbinolamine dehydratase
MNPLTKQLCSKTKYIIESLPLRIGGFPTWEKKRDLQNTLAIELRNNKAHKDIHIIENHHKDLSTQSWTKKIDNDRSYLIRNLTFSTREEAFIFMNIIKEKCEELDHHPEWVLKSNNSLEISLTSHTHKNNVSEKDYNLAAEINREFENSKNYWVKYNKCWQRIWGYSLSAGVVVALYAIFYYFHLNSTQKLTGQNDFYFTRINSHKH